MDSPGVKEDSCSTNCYAEQVGGGQGAIRGDYLVESHMLL